MKPTASAAFTHDQPDCTGILLANLGTPDAPTPAAAVSYTHLDVYKRQAFRQLGRNGRRLAAADRQQRRSVWSPDELIFTRRLRGPVSYTHLDVYKRQGHHIPRRAECAGHLRRSAGWHRA